MSQEVIKTFSMANVSTPLGRKLGTVETFREVSSVRIDKGPHSAVKHMRLQRKPIDQIGRCHDRYLLSGKAVNVEMHYTAVQRQRGAIDSRWLQARCNYQHLRRVKVTSLTTIIEPCAN